MLHRRRGCQFVLADHVLALSGNHSSVCVRVYHVFARLFNSLPVRSVSLYVKATPLTFGRGFGTQRRTADDAGPMLLLETAMCVHATRKKKSRGTLRYYGRSLG